MTSGTRPSSDRVHPGVWLLSSAEAFERYSFYGLYIILPLFLSASVRAGGFGWSDQSALILNGLFGGMTYISPLFGGWAADALIGEKRSVLIGGALLILGNALVVSPWLLSYPCNLFFGFDFLDFLRATGAPLGGFLDAETMGLLRAGAFRSGISESAAVAAYHFVSLSFGCGLVCIVIGIGLFKPSISAMIGRCGNSQKFSRDRAYSIFMIAMILGGALGTLISAYVGERTGWYAGFASAGCGVIAALGSYLIFHRSYFPALADEGKAMREIGSPPALTQIERHRVAAIMVLLFFATIYCIIIFQTGPLSLYARSHVDLARWGWQIPAGWFAMTSYMAFVVFTPFVTRILERLAALGHRVATSRKMALALVIGGIGHLIIVYPVLASVNPDHKLISPIWLFMTKTLFALAESLVWMGLLSLTSRLAPKHLTAFFMGGVYFTMGIGTFAASYVSSYTQTYGVSPVLIFLATLAFSTATLLWFLRSKIAYLTHGIED